MSLQIVLNVIIAFMWMFLSETYTFPSFFTGFLIGALLLFFLRRFIPDAFYLHRVWKMIRLVFLFIKELLLSNIDIVKWVYKPKQTYNPGIFALPTDLKTNWEITILTSLISLTPGTLSVAVSHTNDVIYIHAMDIYDNEEAINAIKDSFEKAIMEVTR
ncbi:monovalent cation/H+ antiporter subunit E [Gracilibacillus halophilus YIM-C55.5]|uniref:Monovalent cation/H+ antiporter subunit E n=1 Tax=Gracilibacillus halophilus YIM-C55.5 TaxID=1308866 RepID=N4WEE5_9BACI|nr:Na+/H+ antiporter subunit E [Gracilibacillus halophilus]ENH97599.1 monovalent cation/H+ antiporter subunit E [Gracilibacillus halophilus YIM-C55.5]